MDFFEQFEDLNGGYIFLSHSHDDIQKVRKIRNRLENAGFEPLCFYLKCLNEDSEIEDLIKREIDAREWFVFVDSENARKSKWVTMEREYIRSTNEKKIFTINIEDSDEVEDTISKIYHNLRIYISYAYKDTVLGQRICNKLKEKDYLVLFDYDSLPQKEDFAETLANAIADASRDGAVLALLTPNSIQSVWVQKELAYAAHLGGNIIPVIVGDTQLPPGLQLVLSKYPQYYLSENPTDQEIGDMVHRIGQLIAQSAQ